MGRVPSEILRQPCDCGSGRRFGSCCYVGRVKAALPAPAVSSIANLKERNSLLLDGIEDIIGRSIKPEEVKHKMSASRVREIYLLVASLFPCDTQIETILPEPSSGLRALYLGSIHPRNILKNVVRYSLYCDEIVVINPLFNPGGMRPKCNPLFDPEAFRDDTLKIVMTLKLLQGWIRQGLVHLLPDPGDFNHKLRVQTWDLAQERLKGQKIDLADCQESYQELREGVERFVLGIPDEMLSRRLKSYFPDKAESEIRAIVDHRTKMLEDDPLALSQLTGRGGQYQFGRDGANLEMSLFIANAANAFPYTAEIRKWKEIMAVIQAFPEDSDTWSPLTKAFQKLEFGFLDNVDVNFAYGMREKGRLGSFRSFMRKIWLAQNPDSDKAFQESTARNFCDELNDEYRKAQAEMESIRNDLNKWAVAAASGTAGLFSVGQLHIQIPSAAVVVKGLSELLNVHLKQKNFRLTTPMSVFIDLARK